MRCDLEKGPAIRHIFRWSSKKFIAI